MKTGLPIDMDGVICRGSEIIPGAGKSIQARNGEDDTVVHLNAWRAALA